MKTHDSISLLVISLHMGVLTNVMFLFLTRFLLRCAGMLCVQLPPPNRKTIFFSFPSGAEDSEGVYTYQRPIYLNGNFLLTIDEEDLNHWNVIKTLKLQRVNVL